MSSRTAQRQPVVIEVNGFAGVRDQRSSAYKAGEMEAIYNLLPESLDRPSKLVLRPGYKRFSSGGTAVQVDSAVGGDRLRWFGFCQLSVGPRYILVSKTQVYSLTPGSFTLTLELTAAQIVAGAAGATLANFAGAVVYLGKLILTDSTGKPYSWNGTTGAGLTSLTNAQTGSIRPTVYAGKLFFLSATTTNRLDWSEEADETIGYGTAPYTTNTWVVAQQSQNTILYAVGTASGLLLFRTPQGIAQIVGEVDSNFQTNATKDDVSVTVGVNLNSEHMAPVYVDAGVLFWDQAYRPCIWRDGQGIVRLWEQLPRAYRTNINTPVEADPWAFGGGADLGELPTFNDAVNCFAPFYDPYLDAHVFPVTEPTNGTTYLFCFHPRTDRLVCIHAVPFVSGGGGIACAPNGLGAFNIKVDSSGFVYFMDPAQTINAAGTWSDEVSNGGGSLVVGTVIGPPHGWNLTVDCWWQRIDVVVEALATHSVSLAWVTSAQHKGSLAAVQQTFTEAGVANVPFERRAEFGIDALGRWIRPQIQVVGTAAAVSRPGIYGYRVEGIPDASGLGRY